MFLFFYFPMQRQHLMKTYVVQGGQVKQGSVSEYPKIPKISPGDYIFQRPFFEGLIFGGAYIRGEICVSKSIGLAL